MPLRVLSSSAFSQCWGASKEEQGQAVGSGGPFLRRCGQKSQLSDFPCQSLLGNV